MLRSLIAVILLTCNLVILASSALVCNALIMVCPWCRGRVFLTCVVDALERCHARGIAAILRNVCCCHIECVLSSALSQDLSYLVLANHRSAVDILVLIAAFAGKAPLLTFFLKQSLRYIPFMGWYCQARGYPFLQRGKVLRTDSLKAMCQGLFTRPMTLVLFAEGTRFHKKKSKEYKHLLSPKRGALTAVLQHPHAAHVGILDTDICYTENASVVNLLCGRLHKVVVQARLVDTPGIGEHSGPALNRWLHTLWREKDERLGFFYQ